LRRWRNSAKPHICNIPAGGDQDRATAIQHHAQTNNILLRGGADSGGNSRLRASARRAISHFRRHGP
jgi:hypothetical protein